MNIEIFKENIGNWLMIYNTYGKLTYIQKIEEIKPIKNNYIIINGALIDFGILETIIHQNYQTCEYNERDLTDIKFISDDEFKNQIGDLIYNSINFMK